MLLPEDITRRDTGSRRGEIAAAARALIAERGFEGLRMRDIADRVGINIATLHYHVPSKEALVGLVAQSLRDYFIAQWESHPRDGLSALDLLRLEFADFRDTLVNNREAFQVMTELRERARRDPAIAEILRPMQGVWHGQVSAILRAGRQDGSFRSDVEPLTGASIIVGAMIASLIAPVADPIAHFDGVIAELERAFSASPPRQDPK
jgi:AcrR family transcriptional regulator